MGAETKIYVRVLRAHEEEVEISAVTSEEAEQKAREMENVIKVLDSEYACQREGM